MHGASSHKPGVCGEQEEKKVPFSKICLREKKGGCQSNQSEVRFLFLCKKKKEKRTTGLNPTESIHHTYSVFHRVCTLQTFV